MVLDRIETIILDMPLASPITMSFGKVTDQTIVLVRAISRDGVTGHGEAGLLGGPHWGVESAESVKVTIDRYIAPALAGQSFSGPQAIAVALKKQVRGNAAARGAVEMALLDGLGRELGLPLSCFFGGALHTHLPVAWTLSTGTTATDIAEGERAFGERGHRQFKLKIGADDPAHEAQRVSAICRAFEGRARVTADINQGWDETTSHKWLPVMADAGLHAIEQPLPAWDRAGMARVQSRLSMNVIADEAIAGLHDAHAVVHTGAARAIALKPNRDGGLWVTTQIAALAEAAGLALYGGTMLETSLGSAALAALYSTIPTLALGTELFGPLRLIDDIVTEPIVVRDGLIQPPSGPGIGTVPDPDKIRFYSRKN
jgi:muconate cycloisomerase